MAKSNLVGTVVPTQEQEQQLFTHIAEIMAGLSFGTTLSPEVRCGFLKPRLGGEVYMKLIAETAREKGVVLEGISLEGMENDLKVGALAFRLEEKLTELQQIAADTRLSAYGEAWQAFLAYYGVLASMAARDDKLANKLRPVIEFMSTGPRAKKAKESKETNG